MMLLHPETDSAGHERFVMHIGRDELRVLHALLDHAVRNMPKMLETEQVRNRCRGLRNDIQSVLAPSPTPTAATEKG